MAGDPSYDLKSSADMDYAEHERTYSGFLSMFKWGTIVVVAILCGMVVSLVGSGGVLGGLATFLIVLAVAYFIAK
ncbi:aa3-type cytochrome c oxidase subunit IV [Fulvimarina sp. 2208YS6-2-32]|uniref:Aa3-type cytochrome c oxidase subunit IV n=1 Tax=Fulvimarina uroteuthidis TaxID=3098149 RepID=A0ABU5I5F6_9HYPH|nr:aa3-type cytochrome c oxidase subunit IV [Fulvimarina sp. 2208YS6-2-32]MDY8109958.1 aa3-type cytochrome c oxidase subunit IV [Fulvimarina sp. 2208YS6-2-32]